MAALLRFRDDVYIERALPSAVLRHFITMTFQYTCILRIDTAHAAFVTLFETCLHDT